MTRRSFLCSLAGAFAALQMQFRPAEVIESPFYKEEVRHAAWSVSIDTLRAVVGWTAATEGLLP